MHVLIRVSLMIKMEQVVLLNIFNLGTYKSQNSFWRNIGLPYVIVTNSSVQAVAREILTMI